MSDKLRRALATWIIKLTKGSIPPSVLKLVAPTTDRHQMVEMSADLHMSFAIYNRRVVRLSKISEMCAYWFSADSVGRIAGKELVVGDALDGMFFVFEDYTGVAAAIDRYAVDFASFEALIMTFFRLPIHLTKELAPEDKPAAGESLGLHAYDKDFVRRIFANELTKALIKACPNRWHRDWLYVELRGKI